ncbi:hypothetical protein C8J57DRAFT_1246188 [Mycena rebaudengoi]|nr:hypothetical protein C8J57DRAFT_1246188 [Mycena rebaudengoi]
MVAEPKRLTFHEMRMRSFRALRRVLRFSAARDEGIEVYDCVFNEMVLVIPWFLAFQGDNPMSSEIASHIGMKGRYFCRVCKAKSDKKGRPPGHAGEIDRLRDFMTAGEPRSKEQTITDLTAQLERSKDKYFEHFIQNFQTAANKLKEEQKSRSGPAHSGLSKAGEVEAMLRQLRMEMPNNLFNPILSIHDFDANSDTPVEILHVVLLGVVKYWWRDAVSRQTSKGKEELKARLSSIDVAGLNTPPIRGNTYVQYAGSLVGRDFRVVLQVALIVLHGLIPPAHYAGWIALSKLTPLMFQPVVEHMPTYFRNLQDAVFDFLAATALWNTQWFNKPKFHLFVHLVEHIRRFGPLILSATETFESYNFVIRLRSVHSSKQAPSLDIGNSFSHLHAIRHLTSGGYVLIDQVGSRIWPPRQAGPGVLSLLQDDEFLRLMSMEGLKDDSRAGFFSPIPRTKPRNWNATISSKCIALLLGPTETVVRCRTLVLTNGDLATVQKYIIYEQHGARFVGRVDEILVLSVSTELLGVLISCCAIGPDVVPYGMPSCIADPSHRLMLTFNELICAVNVAHNCSAHGCNVTRTRRVVQERRTTNHLEDEVTHNGPAEDCILNLAQLRSATDVQQFRSGARYPNTFLVEVIENSIHNKEQLERDLQVASEEKEAEKAEKEAKKAENLEKKRRKEEERKTKAAEKEATRQKLAGEAELWKRKRAETSTVAGPSLTRARKEGEMLDDI